MRRHIYACLVALGRHTITNHIATAGGQFCDWSPDYRLFGCDRFRSELWFDTVLNELLGEKKPDEPVVVAMDDTRLKKTGRKIPGAKYVRDPLGPPFHINFIRAQRVLQISMAAPNGDGSARMIPIDFVHAPSPDKPHPKATQQQRLDYEQKKKESALPRQGVRRLTRLRQRLAAMGEGKKTIVGCVDGSFTNGKMLKQLPENTVVIGRIRSDAMLYYLPEQQPVRGRKRIYGPQAPTPEQLRKDDSVAWSPVTAFAAGKKHDFKIKTLAPLRWRATSDRLEVRVFVIAPLGYRLSKNHKILYRDPAYLICTDPDMSLQDILQYYLWRWGIEVNFRDEKTILGTGQAQVRNARSVQEAPALNVVAYALLHVAARQCLTDLNKQCEILPSPKWRRSKPPQLTTQRLITLLRTEAWGNAFDLSDFMSPIGMDMKPEKCPTPLPSALFYGAGRA